MQLKQSKSSLLVSISILEDIIELAQRKTKFMAPEEVVAMELDEINEKLYVCLSHLKYLENSDLPEG